MLNIMAILVYSKYEKVFERCAGDPPETNSTTFVCSFLAPVDRA
jgi:hypothetical protein